MTDETRPETSGPETGTTAGEPEGSVTATEPEAGAEGQEGTAEEESKKLAQAVEIKDIGPCKKYIKVTVERPAIDARLDEKYSELVTDANVSGFRPGKAPRKIIERRFHKDVTDQVKGEVLMQSLEQLADEHDIAPLSMPKLDPAKIEIPKEGPFVYEFEVEVRPQFNLPDYKGLKLRRPVKTITDDDVAEEERRLLAPYGQLVPKPEGKAELGDYLIADITTRDGERLVSELKEMKVRVEPRLAFKDAVAERFGEQTVGAAAGEVRHVDLTMSENTADAGLRGKKLQAAFDIKDVKSLRLPEMTHELMHEFGVHSPEQLRERIRVLLDWRLHYLQRQSAREQVLERIEAASTWELPQDLLARQARQAMARRVMEMRSSGMSEAEIVARQRLLQQDIFKSTERSLKEHFVLQKIAEVEKIDVDEDDIADEIERIADQENESPRRIRARLEKDDLIDALAAQLVESKALDLILESAEYEDVPMGAKEETPVATVEEQTVPGEMKDPTATPPEGEKAEPTQEASLAATGEAPAAQSGQ